MAQLKTKTRLSRGQRPMSDGPETTPDVATDALRRIFDPKPLEEPVEVTLATPLVRFGLASLLVVNALAALLDPEGFKVLITGNILGETLPSALVRALVMLVATNDLALGGALISGWRPQIVYRWMALWFFAIASLKLLSFL